MPTLRGFSLEPLQKCPAVSIQGLRPGDPRFPISHAAMRLCGKG